MCAFGQESPPSLPQPPKETLASLSAGVQPLVRQRATRFYRMPDGTIWDGWEAGEYRRIIQHSLTPLAKVEPAAAAPGTTFVEDHYTGTAWKLSTSADVKAWDLLSRLGDDRGELRDRVLEKSDPRVWTDAPPLWSSLQARDFSWDFALVDESQPDEYTRKTHGGYLRITKIWGDDRYEFTGYTLDRGEVSGMVRVPDSKHYVQKDRFRGEFFLVPDGTVEQPGGVSREAWNLVPEEQLRMTPDDLANALIQGRAELTLWNRERTGDHYLWKRSVRAIDLAPPPTNKPEEPKKPAPPPLTGGPDLVVLKDGRWFRGQITKRDEHSVTIRTPIGQMETEMTFKTDEVKEVQEPERR